MILEWYLLLRLSLGFTRKILSFEEKHLKFYSKDICSFSVFFKFKWSGVNPTSGSNEIYRKWNF